MNDITSMGEVLIDFITTDAPAGKMSILGSAGGAPANVLVEAGKLGAKTAFVGMIGDDLFGAYLKEQLKAHGIDTSGVFVTPKATTTLGIVKIDAQGERSFEFVRSPGADSCLEESDELYRIFDNTRMIQFGSFSMSREPMRNTMFQVLERYKGKKLIAYDPNLREMVWDDKEEMRRLALKGMEYADILKLGDDEAMLLTGQPDMESAAAYIKEHYPVSVLLVTLGRRGCKYYLGDEQGERPSYQVKSVDTTGAGDCFFGALLYQLLQLSDLKDLTIDQLGEFVTFANAAGAMSTTKKGTMDAMPGREEILACIQQG